METVGPTAKHGTHGNRRRSKLHVGADQPGVIVAQAVTEHGVRDAAAGVDLIHAVDGEVASVTADAAYDTPAIYDTAGARGAKVVVPPKAAACLAGRGPRSPDRDRTIEAAPTSNTSYGLKREAEQIALRSVGHGGLRDLNVRGLPLSKPPYGRLSAIDLDQGEILWQTPHGSTPDRVRYHASLAGVEIPRTGEPCAGLVGPRVTKTLVIMGECSYNRMEGGQRGAMLRAYDKADGREVGAVYMPAPQSGSPMTYLLNGRQYLVLAISGGTYSGEYVAFVLPDSVD